MFLPVNKQEMIERGIERPDFIFVSGDAYVDHPSFAMAIITRVLEANNYSVVILAQPDMKNDDWLYEFPSPRLGFLVCSGNIDSMVNHYFVSKKRRHMDYYSPGGKMGLRPDDSDITYTRKIKSVYKDVPVILGGVEASLRKLAHYDYIKDNLRKSILIESGADLIIYGMGERSIIEVADSLNSGLDIKDIIFINGTAYKTNDINYIPEDSIKLYSYKELKENKINYAKSFKIQYENTDPINSKVMVEEYENNTFVVVNTPTLPFSKDFLDNIYSLPYERTYHPMYEKDGGIPAILEVGNSITINRGCFGSCSFCAITNHQGRIIQSRSKESVIEEAKKIIESKDFKGYINDVGGPTADFYNPSCSNQLEHGTCKNRHCLTPKPCKNVEFNHDDYLDILRALRNLDGVKKVFIRSGIRYDYLYYDKDETFFKELIKYHISGQLRVAPEHVSDNVLKYMQKPSFDLYEKFKNKFYKLNNELNMNQYLIPYLMSSHPGSKLSDAIILAEYLRDEKIYIEQVQDFYPTPSTLATAMYYTSVDPRDLKPVYCAKTKEEKAMQRALIQYKNKDNYDLVFKALKLAHREDLIGNGPKCLIPLKKGYEL